MSHLRKQVLRQFKSLHRTTQKIFAEDGRAIGQARIKINENFKQNKEITEPKEIEELVKLAKDVEVEFKINVIQAVEREPGVYRVRITKDTPMLDNVLFDENSIVPPPKPGACSQKKDAEKIK